MWDGTIGKLNKNYRNGEYTVNKEHKIMGDGEKSVR
jgi:hypothetical protein